jgi:HAD superfamily hydrolase (TIGR01549 family)
MDITCVTFDWGDTLVTNRGNPYRQSLRRALTWFARSLDEQGQVVPDSWISQAEQAIGCHWASSGSEPAEIVAMESLGDAIQQLDGITDWAEQRALVNGFFERFTGVLQPYPEADATMAELKRRGYRVGILSHVPWPAEQCWAWWQRRGWDAHVHFHSFSSEVGYIKPHPAHYKHALALAGVPAEQILHVGDHPERDVVGGQKFGFRTCLRRTEGFYDEAELDACAPDLTVLHVKELLEHLPMREEVVVSAPAAG